ncbi:hypothetical protein ACIQ4I_19225 [Rummeliibacillus sp. NPDC094406]|uniref:hypothetical protein n=1 Tax=Rummeliibacillus sp. NPDC094406 TaxID=3364511 RepID=UPI003805990B
MRRTVFYSALTVIIASFFLNNCYANNKKIGMPIVIPSYISTLADDNLQFTLYYVTDHDDKRTVQVITFGDTYIWGEGDTSGFFEEDSSKLHTIDTFKYQRLNRAIFDISAEEVADIYKKGIIAEDIQVVLSDNTRIPANIKHFEILKTKKKEKLSFISTGGSSDGTGYTKFKAKQNVKLTQMNIPEELKTYYEVQVVKSNQKVDLPIKLSKMETLSINTKVKRNIPFSYDATIPLISNEEVIGFISLLNNPTISEKDIENLVKEYGR